MYHIKCGNGHVPLEIIEQKSQSDISIYRTTVTLLIYFNGNIEGLIQTGRKKLSTVSENNSDYQKVNYILLKPEHDIRTSQARELRLA